VEWNPARACWIDTVSRVTYGAHLTAPHTHEAHILDEMLKAAAADFAESSSVADQTGLLGPHLAGVTFGQAIFVRHGQISNRLVSHDLRRVHQYKAAGSIGAFLGKYLYQIATLDYEYSPLEIDSRKYERDAP
jgi:hypothetical protein